MPQYVRLSSASYEPVSHTDAPPRCHASPPSSHVSWPGSPGAGNRVEAPDLFAGCCRVRRNEAADAVFAARHADDDLVFDHERRERHRVAGSGIGDRFLPRRLACVRVERDQARIDRRHEQFVAENREAAVHAAAARPRVLGADYADSAKTPGRWRRRARRAVFGASVRYMMPSTTSGVVSKLSSDCAWNTHFSSSSSTLPGLI